MHPRVCFKTITYLSDDASRSYTNVTRGDGPDHIVTADGVWLRRAVVFEQDVEPISEPSWWESVL